MALRLFFDNQPAVANWVAQRIPNIRSRIGFDQCTAIGVVKDGVAAAGVVYYQFDPGVNCCVAIAVDDKAWATRGILRGIFHYPFEQMKVRRLTAMIGKKNTASRSLCQRLGFTEEGNVRCGWDGHEHMMIYGMLREECFWLYGKGEHGSSHKRNEANRARSAEQAASEVSGVAA